MVPVPAEVPWPCSPAQAAQGSSLSPIPCLLRRLSAGKNVPGVAVPSGRSSRAAPTGAAEQRGLGGRVAMAGPGGHGTAGWPWCRGVAAAQRVLVPGRSAGEAGPQREPCPCPCKGMPRAGMAGSWLRAGPEDGREDARRESRQPSPRRSWPRSSPHSSPLGIKPPGAGAVPSRTRVLRPRIRALPRAGSSRPPGKCAPAPAGRAPRPGTARCSGGC